MIRNKAQEVSLEAHSEAKKNEYYHESEKNNSDSNTSKKSLIVVADKKNEQYAHYLQILISQDDDTDEMIVGTKDGEVSVQLFDEKQYLENKKKLEASGICVRAQ